MKKSAKIALWGVGTLIVLGAVGYWLFIRLVIVAGGGWGYGIPGGSNGKIDNRIIRTNAPVQVIYRVDKERFLTLENYISCDRGGTVYFNNTTLGIKKKLAGSDDMNSRLETNRVLGYKGIIINNATNGDLVFPNAPTGFCSNNGCYVGGYSTVDQGISFKYASFTRSLNASGISKTYKIVVLDGYFFVYDYFHDVMKYSMGKERVVESVKGIPERELDYPKSDIYYHCDRNIKPDKIEYLQPEVNFVQGSTDE
nr:hypothetical protein [Pantoea sp. 201603H]